MAFKSSLSKELVELAITELGEDEETREKFVKRFRNWIKYHPYIKNCRQDDVFLLRFLRAKKFDFEKACYSLENYLVTLKVFPTHFKSSKLLDPELEQLLESGYLLILPDTEDVWKRILCRPCALNSNQFTALQATRLQNLVFETLLEDEKFQVAGLEYIVDFTGTSQQSLELFSITDYRNFTKYLQDSFPIRLKNCFLVDLPSFAIKTVKLILQLFTEKVRNRIEILNSTESLKIAVDPLILPQECGGNIEISEIIKSTKITILTKSSLLQKSRECNIDLEKLPKWTLKATSEIEEGLSGTFRKIEIE